MYLLINLFIDDKIIGVINDINRKVKMGKITIASG